MRDSTKPESSPLASAFDISAAARQEDRRRKGTQVAPN